MNRLRYRWLAATLALALLLAGCSAAADGESDTGGESGAQQDSAENTAQLAAASGSYAYAAEDLDDSWDPATATAITLDGDSIDVSGGGASADGGTVTITEAGTYVLSGTLDDGQVVVDATKDDLVRLVLNGVRIHNSDSAAIWSKKAGKTVVILAEGTVSTLTDGASYAFDDGQDEPDAVLFAKDDLTITGGGALHVTGSYRNGIGTKDILVITGGDIAVSAAHDGLRGRDGVAVLSGSIDIEADNDGIKSNNEADGKGFIVIDGGRFTIRTLHDAVQAESTLDILGGDFDITTGSDGAAGAAERSNDRGFGGGRGGGFPGETWGSGGDDAMRPMSTAAELDADADADGESTSVKGLKANTSITISGGSFVFDCEDDAIHANGDVMITGGQFTISTGDDGMHADDALVIEDGDIDIRTCYEGLEGATVEISGGSIRIKASDDGINAAGGSDSSSGPGRDQFASRSSYYVHITGGYIEIEAESGDGIDSNGYMVIDGGEIYVQGPVNGPDSALDADGNITINGGVVVGTGSAAMLDMPGSESQQATLAVVYTATQQAGVEMRLDDADGNTVVQFTPQKQYPSVLISAPELEVGESYTLYADGERLGEIELTSVSTTVDEGGNTVSVRGFGGGFGGGPPSGDGMTPPDMGGMAPPDMGEGGPGAPFDDGMMPPGESRSAS